MFIQNCLGVQAWVVQIGYELIILDAILELQNPFINATSLLSFRLFYLTTFSFSS